MQLTVLIEYVTYLHTHTHTWKGNKDYSGVELGPLGWMFVHPHWLILCHSFLWFIAFIYLHNASHPYWVRLAVTMTVDGHSSTLFLAATRIFTSSYTGLVEGKKYLAQHFLFLPYPRDQWGFSWLQLKVLSWQSSVTYRAVTGLQNAGGGVGQHHHTPSIVPHSLHCLATLPSNQNSSI